MTEDHALAESLGRDLCAATKDGLDVRRPAAERRLQPAEARLEASQLTGLLVDVLGHVGEREDVVLRVLDGQLLQLLPLFGGFSDERVRPRLQPVDGHELLRTRLALALSEALQVTRDAREG
jgi:hypothetical protein